MLVESGNFFHMQLYSTHPLSMTKLRQIIWFEGTRMIMLLGGITNRHTEHRNTLGCSKLISLFSKQCSDTPWSCWGTLGKAVGYMWLLLTRRYRTWFCWHSTATSWLLSYNPDNRPSLNTSSGAGLPHSGSKNYVRCSYFTTKYCDEHVCLFIYPIAYPGNHMYELRELCVHVGMALARSLLLALWYVMYFRFCGWRHVFT